MSGAAKKLVSIDDWLRDEANERCELVEGEMVYKALPSAAHSYSQQGISGSLDQLRRKSNGGGSGGGGGWWIGTEASVVYEGRPNGFIHDLAGWRRDKHASRPTGKAVRERPDWVCEILSGNRSNDLVTKKWVLHEHRVEFIWFVDLESGILSVLQWAEKGYLSVADVSPEQRNVNLAPFEEVSLDAAKLFGLDVD